jgi:hypothetical protein
VESESLETHRRLMFFGIFSLAQAFTPGKEMDKQPLHKCHARLRASCLSIQEARKRA